MDSIKLFMSGKLDIQSFIYSMMNDDALRCKIDLLVPKEAINNPNHGVWNRFSYDTMKKYGFSLCRLITGMGEFDGTLGDNLDIFASIRHFYKFNNPQAYCTSYYNEIFSFSLDIVQDCFEGKEVTELVESIAISSFGIKPKSERNKKAKEEIRKLFHVEGNKRPKWIQGAEWPMGKYSPMKYIDRKRIGERVDYYFIDVDTNKERIVQQWY